MHLIQTPLSLLPTIPFLKPTPTLSLLPHPKPKLPPPKLKRAYAPDELPVEKTFDELRQEYGKPKEPLTEDEARKKSWVEHGWAPWEDISTPEGDFAIYASEEGNPISGEAIPLKNPETVEAFKMLRPSYVDKKIRDSGLSDIDWYAQQFAIKGEILDPLETEWEKPVVVTHVAPRDWPPPGWEVDREELEFIREAHGKMNERVDLDGIEDRCVSQEDGFVLDRYKVFLNQYNAWVDANKERLEKEAYKYDQDYYPGRRKRGKDYKEGMYELPFFYPGQLCHGKVTAMHLYQGAFVDVGGVHDGWVPIKGNDWYWIRQFIKVGLHVIVEVTAKRDPYRFRFPLELRFVDPNVDHLVFRRFDYPPIFHRDEDTNPEETLRECGRPPTPRKDPGIKVEEQPLISDHPYVDTLWQINAAEQMILDDIEANPEKYEGKKLSELTDEEEFDEKHRVEFTKQRYETYLLPKKIVKTSVKDLDLEAAFAERQENKRLNREVDKLRRNREMDEYDFIHWRRSFEEREALLRDISCRQALGLPLQEPDRYVEDDSQNPLRRYDYWGEPKSTEKSKHALRIKSHNQKLLGNKDGLYEIPYEDELRRKELKKAELLEEINLEEELPSDSDEDESVSSNLSDETLYADIGDDNDKDVDDEAFWASIRLDDLTNLVEGESGTLKAAVKADDFAKLHEGASELLGTDITADDIAKLIKRAFGADIPADVIDKILDGQVDSEIFSTDTAELLDGEYTA